MEIFDWLFSIENKVVYVIGSIELNDLRNAINGFLEALRVLKGFCSDPFYPGFQCYVENSFKLECATAKGWNTLITEHAVDEEEALEMFYKLLHEYYITIRQLNAR